MEEYSENEQKKWNKQKNMTRLKKGKECFVKKKWIKEKKVEIDRDNDG